MRLYGQILAGIVQLVVPIIVVPRLVHGIEAQAALLTATYLAEFMLWQLHGQAVNEAYRRGQLDGAEHGLKELMPVVDYEPTADDLRPVTGVSSDLF